MADNTEYTPSYDDFAGSSPINALSFLIKSLINREVYTAIPVTVTSVERNGKTQGAGYLSAKPLLQSVGADGNGVSVTNIPRLPYFRYQHGEASIICDPKVGDVGLAIVAKHDCSNLDGSATSKVPATLRTFNLSDSFYIGGFWGKTPTTFVYLEDEGNIEIETTQKVSIKAPTVEINAEEKTTITSPVIELDGALTQGGSSGYSATFNGSMNVKGNVKSDSEVTAQSINLTTHTHSGVEPGGGSTGQPE